MSPAWSPDGTRLAYVSFEQRRPILYMQNVVHGARTRIAEFNGINSAPAWSPDGTKLALTLSRDGNPEIYVMRLSDNALTRLTSHPAIDTEPTWSPDGQRNRLHLGSRRQAADLPHARRRQQRRARDLRG